MLLQCLVDLFVVATYLLLQYLFELANDDLKSAQPQTALIVHSQVLKTLAWKI